MAEAEALLAGSAAGAGGRRRVVSPGRTTGWCRGSRSRGPSLVSGWFLVGKVGAAGRVVPDRGGDWRDRQNRDGLPTTSSCTLLLGDRLQPTTTSFTDRLSVTKVGLTPSWGGVIGHQPRGGTPVKGCVWSVPGPLIPAWRFGIVARAAHSLEPASTLRARTPRSARRYRHARPNP
jgi:hypothetical protein